MVYLNQKTKCQTLNEFGFLRVYQCLGYNICGEIKVPYPFYLKAQRLLYSHEQQVMFVEFSFTPSLIGIDFAYFVAANRYWID